jgi:hypothetical protein
MDLSMSVATLNQTFNIFPQAGVGNGAERYKGYERIYQSHTLENKAKTAQNKLVSGIQNTNNVRNNINVNFVYNEADSNLDRAINKIINEIKDPTAKAIISSFYLVIQKIDALETTNKQARIERLTSNLIITLAHLNILPVMLPLSDTFREALPGELFETIRIHSEVNTQTCDALTDSLLKLLPFLSKL